MKSVDEIKQRIATCISQIGNPKFNRVVWGDSQDELKALEIELEYAETIEELLVRLKTIEAFADLYHMEDDLMAVVYKLARGVPLSDIEEIVES